MPRHVSHALDLAAAWPRLDGLTCVPGWLEREGHVAYPAGGAVVAEYLESIGVWQRLGFELSPDERARIRDRPDQHRIADRARELACDA